MTNMSSPMSVRRGQGSLESTFNTIFAGDPSRPIAQKLPQPPPRPAGSGDLPQGEGESHFGSRKTTVTEVSATFGASGPMAAGFTKDDTHNFLETSKRRVDPPGLRDQQGRKIAYRPASVNLVGERHVLPQDHPAVEAYQQTKTLRAAVAPPEPYYHDANHSWTLGLESDPAGESAQAGSAVHAAGRLSDVNGSPVPQSSTANDAASSGYARANSLRTVSPETRVSMRVNEPSKEVPRIGAIARSSRPMKQVHPQHAHLSSILGAGVHYDVFAETSETHAEPVLELDPLEMSQVDAARAKHQKLLKSEGVGTLLKPDDPDFKQADVDESDDDEEDKDGEGRDGSPSRRQSEFVLLPPDEKPKSFGQWENFRPKPEITPPEGRAPPATMANLRCGDDDEYLRSLGHRVRTKVTSEPRDSSERVGGMHSDELSVKDAPPYFFDTGEAPCSFRKKRGYAWDAHSQVSLPGTTLADPLNKGSSVGQLINNEFKNIHGRRGAGASRDQMTAVSAHHYLG